MIEITAELLYEAARHACNAVEAAPPWAEETSPEMRAPYERMACYVNVAIAKQLLPIVQHTERITAALQSLVDK